MPWTDDRVATLKQLWNDGESASAIAQTIGEVTRNAVIGKVHRLGLAGRATTARKPRTQRTLSLFPERAPSRRRSLPRARKSYRGRSVAREKRPLILPELGPPPDFAVTVQTLTALSCRWPIGDPKLPGFHFCGRFTAPACPYCSHHAGLAYQQGRRR
ncbi:MAG: GcrA family cell cycle regulator [Rhodomicrobium sp.]